MKNIDACETYNSRDMKTTRCFYINLNFTTKGKKSVKKQKFFQNFYFWNKRCFKIQLEQNLDISGSDNEMYGFIPVAMSFAFVFCLSLFSCRFWACNPSVFGFAWSVRRDPSVDEVLTAPPPNFQQFAFLFRAFTRRLRHKRIWLNSCSYNLVRLLIDASQKHANVKSTTTIESQIKTSNSE